MAVLRSVASIVQESLPDTSGHALHRHRLRSAPGAERGASWNVGAFERRRLNVPWSRCRWSQAEQAARDAAGAGPHGEQAGARDGLISSRNRQVGEVPEIFRRLRRAWRLAALLNFCMGAREKRLEFC